MSRFVTRFLLLSIAVITGIRTVASKITAAAVMILA